MAPELRKLLGWASGCSLAAAAIHFLVMPEHLAEWWGYGAFFMVAAVAQLWYAVALSSAGHLPSEPALDARGAAPGWRWSLRSLYLAGIAGNVALIALWAVTRTVGVPFLGPGAGVVEQVTVVSVLSKVIEVALVALLAVILTRSPRAAPAEPVAIAATPLRHAPRRHNP